jgi:hypothetical protein
MPEERKNEKKISQKQINREPVAQKAEMNF